MCFPTFGKRNLSKCREATLQNQNNKKKGKCKTFADIRWWIHFTQF